MVFTYSFALLPNGRDRFLGLAMAPTEAYLARAHTFLLYTTRRSVCCSCYIPFRVCRVFGLGVDCRNAKKREKKRIP